MNKSLIIKLLLKKMSPDSALRKKYNIKKIKYWKSLYLSSEEKNDWNNQENRGNIILNINKKSKSLIPDLMNSIDYQIKNNPNIKDKNANLLIEKMLYSRLVYGFDPSEFICYELENKSHDEIKQYVSDYDLMVYVYRLNDRLDLEIFNDKAKTYDFFKDYYYRDALTICSKEDYTKFIEFTNRHPIFVKKCVNEAMGRGIELIDLVNSESSINEIFESILSQGKCILEEKIIQGVETSIFNKSSVNTIRMITFNLRKDIIVPYCFMKIGRKGSFVDNGGAGGILVGIDPISGVLITDGYDEFNTKYTHHPDTHVKFKGYKLPEFNQAIKLAKILSSEIPSVKFIGWDFAYTKNGWIIVEGNGMSQLIGPQTVFKKGIKSEIEYILKKMDLKYD